MTAGVILYVSENGLLALLPLQSVHGLEACQILQLSTYPLGPTKVCSELTQMSTSHNLGHTFAFDLPRCGV